MSRSSSIWFTRLPYKWRQSLYPFRVFIISCLILTQSSSIILNLFLWTVALESDFMTNWSVYSRRITISKFDIYLSMMTEKFFIVILGLLGHNRMGKTCAPKIFVFWDTLLFIHIMSSNWLTTRLYLSIYVFLSCILIGYSVNNTPFWPTGSSCALIGCEEGTTLAVYNYCTSSNNISNCSSCDPQVQFVTQRVFSI